MSRSGPSGSSQSLALILIDFDNLIEAIPGAKGEAQSVVRSMIVQLRYYLRSGLDLTPSRAIAFGDFGRASPPDTMDNLVSIGVEAHHVPAGGQEADSATALAVQATKLLYESPQVSGFVVLSANHWFLPLVRELKRAGKSVQVAALSPPPSNGKLWSEVGDAFLDANVLHGSQKQGGAARSDDTSQELARQAPTEISRIEDAGAMGALEIIDEYFGHYEEVYLTPLLRRLTEMLYIEDGEPKDLVTRLQDGGAVWLEKRRGFPHDYTVLMVNEKHPDVMSVRAESASEVDSEGSDSEEHQELPDQHQESHGHPDALA